MLGLDGQEVHQSNLGWSPVYVEENLAVMSIGFLLSKPDDAIIWRGPRKNSIIKSFLKDTYWGDEQMDILIVDAPPGTSDEHISIVKLLESSKPGVICRVPFLRTDMQYSLIWPDTLVGPAGHCAGCLLPHALALGISSSIAGSDGSYVTKQLMSLPAAHTIRQDGRMCEQMAHSS